ncbi:MAG TPA: hypothetical protein PKC08_07635, partial [Pseudomonadales bacterium]|nr:hypothetical protein [Pseudomonadales bacterium]
LVPAARSLDSPFHEFMADEIGMTTRVYEKAALELTPTARARLERYIAEHPRGKEGKIVYHFARDFGIEPAALRERFAFYFERFPVRAEVR